MLVNYQYHLVATRIFPKDVDSFSFNSITMKDNISLVNYPDYIALMSVAGNMTTVPPVKTGPADKSNVTCSPSDFLKKIY